MNMYIYICICIQISWHEWQSDTSKCSRSRLDLRTYWNSSILISGDPRAARYVRSKSSYSAVNSDSFVHVHRRHPDRQVNLTVSKNTNSSYNPTRQAVKRQADLVDSDKDITHRIQQMMYSNETAAARIRTAVQDDQKKGHNPFIVKIDFQIDHGRMFETTVEITKCLRYKRKIWICKPLLQVLCHSIGLLPFRFALPSIQW